MTRIAFAFLLLAAAIFIAVPAQAACPSGYAAVPALAPYTTQSYCVMQYEARNVGGVPTSQSTGAPWATSKNAAVSACGGLGYGIPSNALWQAMARQAEASAANWSGGDVGRGQMGRNVTLANGATLYNVGDSLWEHVSTTYSGTLPTHSRYIRTISDVDYPETFSVGGVAGTTRFHFGPAASQFNDTGNLSSLGWMTGVYAEIDDIMRGGDDSDPGIFGVALNHNDDVEGDDTGFRCAFAEPTGGWQATMAGNASGYAGRSSRQVVAGLGDGNQIRVTLAASTAEAMTIKHVSVVERSGSTSNGTGTPVEIKFGGASGASLAAGATLTSDWTNFTVESGKTYLVIVDYNTGNPRYGSSTPGFYWQYSTESWSQQNVSGYDFLPGYAMALQAVEVRTFP
jgi:hypothetical protein